MYHVYLAGPISGLTFDGAQDCRTQVCNRLEANSPIIKTLSPLRGKEYLKMRGPLEGSYGEFPLSTDQGLTARDRWDCQRADVVIFNMLGAQRVSIGTCFEFAWADSARNIGILVMEPEGNPHDYPMVRETCKFRVTTLEDAIKITEAILLG